MTSIASVTPVQQQVACWQLALAPLQKEPRRSTSGGPRDRGAHLAYQRGYQRNRTTFGVRLSGSVVYYRERSKADRVRRVLRALPFPALLEHADMAAAGLSAEVIVLRSSLQNPVR